MSDREWAVCEPLLPAPAWLAGKGGRPSRHCMRDVVDGIRYLTHNGPVWRALPADFPPAGTVYWWADKWQADGSAERMHDDLRERIRGAAGRGPGPTAAIIDFQSVKGSEMITRVRRGYDAGKKINGTKRHIAVDVMGLLLTVLVTAASLQDRDAAPAHRPGLRAAGRPPRDLYLLGHDHRHDPPPRPPGRNCQHLSTSSLRCCLSFKHALTPALTQHP
jgi:transposase